jgi:hypothetical protein
MKVIQQAAIWNNGIIYKGKRHKDIVMSQPKHLNIRKGGIEGFLTTSGIFLDRKEAADLAYQMGQISEPVDELKSEHIY